MCVCVCVCVCVRNWILKDKIRCFIRLLIFFTFNLLIKDAVWGSVFEVGCGAGEQLGVRCLAQGSHLSRGIEGGESAGYSLPPDYNPCRT